MFPPPATDIIPLLLLLAIASACCLPSTQECVGGHINITTFLPIKDNSFILLNHGPYSGPGVERENWAIKLRYRITPKIHEKIYNH